MVATGYHSILPSEYPVALVLFLGGTATANDTPRDQQSAAIRASPVTRAMLVPSRRLLALLSLTPEELQEVLR